MIKFVNKTVPTSSLRLSEFNWKRNITEESISDLAENIDDTGNINPITVRPVGKGGHMYEVIAGRRRYLAQRKLGLKKIEVRVAKLDDLDAEIFSYSENLKIERPDSREWSRGVKHLVDLFEKKRAVGMPKKPKTAAKSKGSDEPEFRDAASLNSGRGRKATPRQQAIKDAAKTVNASTKAVRRAVRREEDLIPSASRALDQGKITQEQADILSTMSTEKQRQQLINMVRESRDETRQRLSKEKVEQAEDKTAAVSDMLRSIYRDCSVLKDKVDTVLSVMDNSEVDYESLTKLPSFQLVEPLRDALTDLLEVVEP